MSAQVIALRPLTAGKLHLRGMTDNLPAGAHLDLAADFVRFFRPELEARLSALPVATPEASHEPR